MAAHGQRITAALLILLCVDGVGGYSKVGIESDGEMALEDLATYGTLGPDGRFWSGGVMEEVQRLASAGRTDAVQAMIHGTSAMAVNHQPGGEEMQKHVNSFEEGMRGETFMESDDTPENARRRRALFMAACRTLANDAKKLND